MSWKKNIKYEYVKSTPTDSDQNKAAEYASKLVKSNIDLATPSILGDYDLILKDKCVYLKNFFCRQNDLTIFYGLQNELKNDSVIKWSSHFKFENPTYSDVFNSVVTKMAEYFNVKVLQTRLNYYANETSFKPLHKDKHAYNDGTQQILENFTMGASFGASRNLDFVHDETEKKFSFPQNNGDLFAFDSEINKKFKHGVPKTNKKVGPRFSIIAWGIK